MTTLGMGANTTLPASAGDVVIRHRDSAGIDVNLTAFLVASSGKVRSDADKYEALQHFLADSPWDPGVLDRAVAERVVRSDRADGVGAG